MTVTKRCLGAPARRYYGPGVYRPPDTMPVPLDVQDAGALKKAEREPRGRSSTSSRTHPPLSEYVDEYETLLRQPHLKQRTSIFGVFAGRALALGFTGRCARFRCRVGLRKKQPTRLRPVDFDIPGRRERDCYTVSGAVEECDNPTDHQAVHRLAAQEPGPVIHRQHKVAPPSRVEMKSNMEELIHISSLSPRASTSLRRGLPAVSTRKGNSHYMSPTARTSLRMKIRAAVPICGAQRDDEAYLADVVRLSHARHRVGEIDR